MTLLKVSSHACLRNICLDSKWFPNCGKPRFAEKHLQRYNNSSSRNLLANLLPIEEFKFYKGLHVVELQNDSFHLVLAIEHSREDRSRYDTLCHCDGLFLECGNILDGIKTYVLWNPSCRVYREICCPQEIDDSGSILYGIYYHPLKNDYIADKEHYAVFSCRCNKWSEVKEIQGITRNIDLSQYRGVSCNGYVYWSLVKIERHAFVAFEIIYFDWKDETFKKLALPDCNGKVVFFFLTFSGDHLYLFNSGRCHTEMRVMKKPKGDGKDLWMEIKQPLQSPLLYPIPICWVSADEILLRFNNLGRYVLYDLRKNTMETIHNCQSFEYDYVVPYPENLFLQ